MGAKKTGNAGTSQEWPEFLPGLPMGETFGHDPQLVAAGDGDSELGSLFIALALVFNDLKGAIALAYALKPFGDETTQAQRAIQTYGAGAVGEVSGVSQQVMRITAGILHELMVLLDESRATVETERFSRLVDDFAARTEDRVGPRLDGRD